MNRIKLSSNEVTDIFRAIVLIENIENSVFKNATMNDGQFDICEKIIDAEKTLIELIQNSKTY